MPTDVCEQYAEAAAGLVLQRRRLIRGYRVGLGDLVRLDERIEAHLDALLVSGPPGEDALDQLVRQNESGAVFARTALYLLRDSAHTSEWVAERCTATPHAEREITDALAWLPHHHVSARLNTWLAFDDTCARRIALQALTSHQVVCAQAASWVEHKDDGLACAALRHLAILRSGIRFSTLNTGRSPAVRYWTAWARLFLGGAQRSIVELTELALQSGDYQHRSRDLCLVALPVADAHELLRTTTETGADALGQRVRGSALVGDPRYVGWLVELMKDPAIARVAGDAFCGITGIDLVHRGMDGKPLDGHHDSEDDREDTPSMTNADDELLWPDVTKVADWWTANRSGFTERIRYLCGDPLSAASCRSILRSGYQRSRIVAALHLGYLQPEVPVFDVESPGWRQEEALKRVENAVAAPPMMNA